VKDQKATHIRSSYRGIFKATSLFGGVQFYQILINVVKSKFIAMLLGPLGVGIQGLYQSALHFIQSITAMGLSSSAVRNVSEANASGDMNRVSEVVGALRKLVWWTGLLGLIAVSTFSPMLSKTSFGDDKHIIPFICLSVTLLLDQICAGQRVVLQGMRQLKDLAKASLIGAAASLFISVPLYYFYGIKGIVPTLILNSVTLLIVSWYYAKKIPLLPVEIGIFEVFREGKGMLKMGLAMSWSGILVNGSAYLLRWFIRKETGTEAVGLYTAGFTIINTYVGMIFTAIGTDYYPRLSEVNSNNEKMSTIVNQQGEISVLILAPLLLLCIIFMPLVIRLLYTEQFLGSNGFIRIAAVGMMFKLCSWLIAFQFIAKGESRLFVINETVANVYFLVLNLVGYKLLGLDGLGYAFTISYLLYFIQVFVIAKKRYGFGLTKAFARLLLVQLVLVSLCFGATVFHWQVLTYLIGAFLILCSSFFSLKELNKLLDLKSSIISKLNRNR
jgi:PST family polysaccharide transporter